MDFHRRMRRQQLITEHHNERESTSKFVKKIQGNNNLFVVSDIRHSSAVDEHLDDGTGTAQSMVLGNCYWLFWNDHPKIWGKPPNQWPQLVKLLAAQPDVLDATSNDHTLDGESPMIRDSIISFESQVEVG